MFDGIEVEQAGKKTVKMGMEFNKEITRTTLKKKLPMWTKYTWENIDRLKRKAEKKGTNLAAFSIERLRPKFLHLPTLIVGWGDSFHSTVDLLKQIPRDKCNIVACDRCLRKLVDNGVIPDLVTNLDAGPQIRPFYKTSLPESEMLKIPAALAVCTDPHQVQWIHGPKYWYVPAITPWGNTLTEESVQATHYPCVPTAGNIGTASIMLSRALGANPTYLIGIDFGYMEYANGMNEKAKDVETINPKELKLMSDPTKLPKVWTSMVLSAYAHATRHLLITYDLNIVNIGGGLLHGKWIKTLDPPPHAGGDARARMEAFIKTLNNWKIPAELQGQRMLFLANPRSTNPHVFVPMRRDLAKESVEMQDIIKKAMAEQASVDYHEPV